MPQLLELFSGTQSMSKVFKANGWETFTIENDPYFEDITSWTEDILKISAQDILERMGTKPKVIWASPPCTAFSVASISHHWGGGKRAYEPKTDLAIVSKELVVHTINLIKELDPVYWFIENPRGVLRKMPFMEDLPIYTVWYCTYKDLRAKPTDIWTNHPNPQFKPVCHNGNRNCHHQPAKRGSKTGTQGLKNARERAKIPEDLCKHIFSICNQ